MKNNENIIKINKLNVNDLIKEFEKKCFINPNHNEYKLLILFEYMTNLNIEINKENLKLVYGWFLVNKELFKENITNIDAFLVGLLTCAGLRRGVGSKKSEDYIESVLSTTEIYKEGKMEISVSSNTKRTEIDTQIANSCYPRNEFTIAAMSRRCLEYNYILKIMENHCLKMAGANSVPSQIYELVANEIVLRGIEISNSKDDKLNSIINECDKLIIVYMQKYYKPEIINAYYSVRERKQ